MLVRPAEDSFQRGMEAYARGKRLEALALFEAALTVERQLGGGGTQPRYLSYYGLCLGLETRKMSEAIDFCREATTGEFYNPDLYCNLAQLLLAAGRKKDAHEVILKGLRWERRHAGLVRTLRSMGRRRRPVLPFLSRTNPINVLLGRMTYPQRAA